MGRCSHPDISPFSLKLLMVAARRELAHPKGAAGYPKGASRVAVAAIMTVDGRIAVGNSSRLNGDGRWLIAERDALRRLKKPETISAIILMGNVPAKRLINPYLVQSYLLREWLKSETDVHIVGRDGAFHFKAMAEIDPRLRTPGAQKPYTLKRRPPLGKARPGTYCPTMR